MRGHSEPSAILSGKGSDCSVQGQPVLPSGAGGKSFKVKAVFTSGILFF
jgi:hypothetical protein